MFISELLIMMIHDDSIQRLIIYIYRYIIWFYSKLNSLHHSFHLHGEHFLWFTPPDGSGIFLKVHILRSQGHDRWCAQAGEKVPKTISNPCKENSWWWIINIDSIHEHATGTLSPLVMSCRMFQLTRSIWQRILLMAEILHQSIGSLSHYS